MTDTRSGRPRYRYRIVAFAVACIVVIVVGAGWWLKADQSVTFVAVAATRAQLINGIESYVRVEDFVADLARRSVQHEVARSQRTSADSRRPPFEITTVTIRSFSHLGHTGLLTVSFFNDRLLGVRFFPVDVEGYLTALRLRQGIDLKSRNEATPSEHTHVYVATEHQQGRYIGWEDTRLAEEMRLWIKRYS